MAERLNKRQADSTRTKIKTSQIINRLQNHVDGKVDLSSTQVRSAEILLKHSLPALQAVEMDVGGEGLTIQLVSQRADTDTGD